MNPTDIFDRLSATIAQRQHADADSSYVARLFHKGQDHILKKIGEEATEVVLASKDQDAEHLVREVADLWFHSMVLLRWHGLDYQAVANELARREGLSGITEKASRPQE
jgi:phosphoribosyl-ATP pyrophosphohydrolase